MDMREANLARLASFREMAPHAGGVRWLATFDTSCCAVCAALDGASWNLEGEPIRGNTIRMQVPPHHEGCRCVLTLVPKSLDEIAPGLEALRESLSQRASKDGPIASNTAFDEFLKGQTPDVIESILGSQRAQLFCTGQATLRDFISDDARLLMIDELDVQ